MEGDVGDHCSFAECKRLDFLPFVCDHCKQTFCKDHRLPSSHNCQHFDGNESSASLEKQEFLFKCSLSGCSKRDVAEVTCSACRLSYCIQHRHQEDHNCPELSKEGRTVLTGDRGRGRRVGAATKPAATSSAKGGRSSKQTSAKVALMKLKMRAVGLDSIPQSERVYFEVQLPRTSGLPNTSMFFSKKWSVGRIVDYTAQRYNLKNENHKPQAQKLQLSWEGGVLVMSEKMGAVLDTVVPMGTTLKLEYEKASS